MHDMGTGAPSNKLKPLGPSIVRRLVYSYWPTAHSLALSHTRALMHRIIELSELSDYEHDRYVYRLAHTHRHGLWFRSVLTPHIAAIISVDVLHSTHTHTHVMQMYRPGLIVWSFFFIGESVWPHMGLAALTPLFWHKTHTCNDQKKTENVIIRWLSYVKWILRVCFESAVINIGMQRGSVRSIVCFKCGSRPIVEASRRSKRTKCEWS